MSWQSNYQQPSFRGVDFSVGSVRVTGGRRIIVHQFPRSDKAAHEDNGAEDKIFSLSGFLVGKDFWDRWSDLETAFDVGGSAFMVHPYRGTLNVVLDSYSCDEISMIGNFVNFSFTVHLDRIEKVYVYKDPVQRVVDTREQLSDTSSDMLKDRYATEDKPWAAIQDARDTLTACFSGLESARKTAATGAAFKREIESARGDVIAISLNAESINNEFKALVDFGLDLVTDSTITKSDQLRELRQSLALTTGTLTNTNDSSYNDDYPARQIQARLAYELIGASAYLITKVDFFSLEQATSEQEELFSHIDSLCLESIVSDDVFSALKDIKSAVFDYIQNTAVGLPRLIVFKPTQGDNVLSMSYRYYGNIIEADTIAAMNDLVHPGFVSSGIDLMLRSIDE